MLISFLMIGVVQITPIGVLDPGAVPRSRVGNTNRMLVRGRFCTAHSISTLYNPDVNRNRMLQL